MNDPLPAVLRWAVLAALAALLALSASTSPAVQRIAVLALGGLAVLPVLGWLRTLWFAPVAVAGLAAWTAASVLHLGQAVPVAALIATVTGVLAGASAALLTQRAPAPARPWVSLGLAVGVWAIVLPLLGAAPAPPPLLFGIDLASGRSLAVSGLALVGLGVWGLGHLSRSRAGRQIGAAGSSPTLALRSGATMPAVWVRAGVVSGVLAGWAGLLLALDVQSVPPAGQFSAATALAWLAVPLLGGPAWVSGVLVGAVIIGGLSALGLPEVGIACLALAAAALTDGAGLVGTVTGRSWRR